MRIIIRQDIVLQHVSMSTAYAAARGKASENEEILVADTEFLDRIFQSASSKAAIELSPLGVNYNPLGEAVEWDFPEIEETSGSIHAVETLLYDFYTDSIMRAWFGLLRETDTHKGGDTSTLATSIGKLIKNRPENNEPAHHRHVRRPLFPV